MVNNGIPKERPTIKSINFDLFTNKMKSNGVYPDGYRTLGNSLVKCGFEHRQGSGYVSKKKITSGKVFVIIQKITKENPWLKDCVNKMDVSDVQLTKQYDLTTIIQKTNTTKQTQQQSNEKNVSSADKHENAPIQDNGNLDIIAVTMEQCRAKIDAEIALAKRTQKENIQQQVRQVEQVGQVRQVQQVRKGKTKIKEKKDNSGKR